MGEIFNTTGWWQLWQLLKIRYPSEDDNRLLDGYHLYLTIEHYPDALLLERLSDFWNICG
jgi:hypothetical protein